MNQQGTSFRHDSPPTWKSPCTPGIHSIILSGENIVNADKALSCAGRVESAPAGESGHTSPDLPFFLLKISRMTGPPPLPAETSRTSTSNDVGTASRPPRSGQHTRGIRGGHGTHGAHSYRSVSMGLTVSERAVRFHGGSITARNRPEGVWWSRSASSGRAAEEGSP